MEFRCDLCQLSPEYDLRSMHYHLCGTSITGTCTMCSYLKAPNSDHTKLISCRALICNEELLEMALCTDWPRVVIDILKKWDHYRKF